MAGQWVDDPSWGNVFNGFFPDSGKVGQAQLAAEHIKALQLKRAQDQEQLQAIRSLIDRQNAQYNNMAPPATEIPMPPNFDFGTGGAAGAVPFTPGAGGMGTQVTPAEPLRLSNVPRSWGLDEPFYRNREEARAVANLGPYLAKSPEALIKGNTGSSALAQLKLYGIPSDQQGRDILGTQLSTVDAKLPGMTGAATHQPTVHNYAYTDPATGEHVTGRTINGLTDITTGRPIPGHAAMAGTATLEPKDTFASADLAKAEVANLARKIQQGRHLTEVETQRAGLLLDRAYPEKLVTKEEGGRQVTRIQREEVIPPELDRLVALVNTYRNHPAGQWPDLPPPAPMGAGAAVPYLPPDMPTGTVPPAMDTTLPPPEPIVPGPAQRQMGNTPSEAVNTGPINALSLADNMRQEPVYKKFSESIDQWNHMSDLAKGGRKGVYNNATDLALIYTAARIMDDRTGVRDQEMLMYQRLGTAGETVQAMIQRYLQGSGILPPDVRADIVYMAERKIAAMNRQWDKINETYTERAVRGNVDPKDIVPKFVTMDPVDYDRMEALGHRSMSAQPEQPTAPNQPPNIRRIPGTDQPPF